MLLRTGLIALFALPGLLLAPVVSAETEGRGAIVQITTTYQEPSYFQPWKMEMQSTRTGSGCIVAGKRILTNAHVVSDQTFIQVRRAGEAESFVAEVAAVSHELDLALLKVADDDFFDGTTPLDVGDLPEIGDPVSVLGFPKGGTRITLTQGIVSRIDRSNYSHSGHSNLICQIDAAINPGSSGGPVLADGDIAGVAFQTGKGENIGYVIPAPVVKHFLEDLADGRHDGVPGIVFASQSCGNNQMRRHRRLPAGETGVLVTRVAPRFEGPDKLQAGDVLLTIDGHDVAGDGTIEVRPGERITFRWAIDRRQVGESVKVRVWRKGAEKDVSVELVAAKRDYGYLVPRRLYDLRPTYYIVGGLVFSPLTTNYYDAWDSWDDVPTRLMQYHRVTRNRENENRRQVIVLIDYLPASLNVSYDFEDSIVSTVNGRTISDMRDLVTAFEDHEGEEHRIVFEDNDWEVVFQRDRLEKEGPKILENYGVPADRSADLKGEQ